MSDRKKERGKDYNFKKNITFKQEQYAKDSRIEATLNQAGPAPGGQGDAADSRQRLEAQSSVQEQAEAKAGAANITMKEKLLREEAEREARRSKDPRADYDFDADVRYKKTSYAKNDLIDRPVNQVQRYAIKAHGVKPVEESPTVKKGEKK